MNAVLKPRWSEITGKFRFGGIRRSGSLFLMAVATSTAWALDPSALPTNGQVQGGASVATISQSGARMDINQSAQNAILNWSTFNIGSAAQVNFFQPSSSAIALNRVSVAGGVSEIAGQLNAIGSVFLVNPSGVVFSSTAQVSVGGLVASSLDIADSDFLSGNYVFAKDGSAGDVSNAGTISTLHGVIALLAPKVANDGFLSATGGVALGAGDRVRLDLNGSSLIGIEVEQAALAAAISSTGNIAAPGGRVVIKSDDLYSVVNLAGTINAKTITVDGQHISLGGSLQVGDSSGGSSTLIIGSGGATGSAVSNSSGAGATICALISAYSCADATVSAGGHIISGPHFLISPFASLSPLAPLNVSGPQLTSQNGNTVTMGQVPIGLMTHDASVSGSGAFSFGVPSVLNSPMNVGPTLGADSALSRIEGTGIKLPGAE